MGTRTDKSASLYVQSGVNSFGTLLAVDMAPAIFAVECMACVWCPMAITRELTFIFLAFCFRRFTSCLAKVVAA